jgi:hypothetical protein
VDKAAGPTSRGRLASIFGHGLDTAWHEVHEAPTVSPLSEDVLERAWSITIDLECTSRGSTHQAEDMVV